MLKKILVEILIVCLVICALKITYSFGHRLGTQDAEMLHAKQKLDDAKELHQQLFELDHSFLTNLSARPNTLASGLHTLNVRYAGQPPKTYPVTLAVTNGKLSRITMATLGVHDIVQTGNVISWKQGDMDEGPDATFVGLVDGYEMSGWVYLEPGSGWHEGQPPAYGIWHLKPAPAPSTTPTKSD